MRLYPDLTQISLTSEVREHLEISWLGQSVVRFFKIYVITAGTCCAVVQQQTGKQMAVLLR